MASTVQSAAAIRFVWSGGDGLVRESAALVRQPLIADSWLVDDGRVRGLEMHEQRFSDACARLLPDLTGSTVRAFLGSVRLALPRTGRWFPRIEVHGRPDAQLAVWLRPAPQRTESATLWIAPGGDPRSSPQIKGPDLAVLAALRERARTEGADDALLCASDTSVLEAAHSSLVWWRKEVLCLPTAESSILPSVTRRLLLELAQRRDVGVIRERMRPPELAAVETWALNALHGIRPVSNWLGLTGVGEACPPVTSRLRQWITALDELMVPVDNLPTE
jgi:branched-subunit amino acid aminotransferase/4-amino-4-deoxychorismate lyase